MSGNRSYIANRSRLYSLVVQTGNLFLISSGFGPVLNQGRALLLLKFLFILICNLNNSLVNFVFLYFLEFMP